MNNKKKLKGIDFSYIPGLSTETIIYVNSNLSPAFKELNYFCRMLKKDGLISLVDTSSTFVKIKVKDSIFKINHVHDLQLLFPGREFVSLKKFSTDIESFMK